MREIGEPVDLGWGLMPSLRENPTLETLGPGAGVLTLIGHGLGTRLIAEYLHLSVKTVESHRAHLKEKLNIATAPELVRFGVEWVRSQEPV